MKTMLDVVGAVKEYVDNKQPSYNPTEATIDFTDIISIADAFPKAAKDVRLKVEAVQDLHGYDKPWVGGAGKNKCPLTIDGIKAVNTSGTWSGNVYTYRGITYTINVDGDDNITSIKVNGTASENSFLRFTDSYQTASQLGLELNTTYTLSGCPSGGGASTYNIRYDSGGAWSYPIDAGNGIQFTFTSSTNTYGPRIYIGNGTTVNNILFYPQMEKGTKTAFESYTNICPISGWNNAKVTRGGKNLLSYDLVSLKADNTYGTWNNSTYTMNDATFTLNADKTISVSKPSASTSANSIVLAQNVYIPTGTYKVNGNPSGGGTETRRMTVRISDGTSERYVFENGSGAEFTLAEGEYLKEVNIRIGGSTTFTGTISPMIRPASISDATYEPYQGKEITISLNGTRYGCTLDVTSGVLTLDKKYVDLGTLSYSTFTVAAGNLFRATVSDIKQIASNSVNPNFICSNYPSIDADHRTDYVVTQTANSSTIDVIDSRYSDTTTFKAAMDGVGLIYELATPQTIQLTAEEIYLLYGYNTLFGDCGDISLTYNPATYGNIVEEVSSKMDKSNPTGTGSFSLNRKANTTVGNHSFAEGYNTTASGACSHAEGSDTKAYQPYAHAEGYNTTASKQSSHAEGTATTASANCAHAEGNSTTASAKYAHAEGAMTKASGEDSHAEGFNTTASGFASHAEGRNNVAGYNCQHVSGKYNDNKATTLFEVGNGESTSNRSNAFEVYSDGSLSTDNGTTKVKLEDLIKTLVFGGDARTNYKFSWSTSNSNIVVLRGVKGENANYRATFRLYTDGKLYSLWKEVSNGNLSDFDVAIDDSGYLNITIPTYSQWRLEFLPTAGIVYASST